MAFTLTPLPFIGITPAGGMRIYTYESGTTTSATTYADAAGATPFGAYVESDADGLFPAIYLPLQAFKFSLYLSGVTPPSPAFATCDPVNAVPSDDDLGDVTGTAGEALAANELAYLSDGSGGKNPGQWYLANATDTYSSITAQLAYPTEAIASGASGTFRQIGRQAGLSALTPGTTYYVSAALGGAITAVAPSNARAVGVSDTSTSLVLFPQPRWQDAGVPVVQTTTSTGTQDNFAITSGPTAIYLRCNNATALTLTGFATPSAGKRIEIVCIGAGRVTLANATGSSAANQVITGFGANLVLEAALGRATLLYDGTTARWRVQNYTAASANLILEGVQFPATQVPSTDVNCLDDYQEGSWTPVLGGSGGTSGQVYTSQTGRYIKVGRLVSAAFRITLSTKGTITTNCQIQGLPFTVVNVAGLNYPGAISWAALNTTWVSIVVLASPNTLVANVQGAAAAAIANQTALTTADILDTTEMQGVITYFADT